jgi:hypothetical protein
VATPEPDDVGPAFTRLQSASEDDADERSDDTDEPLRMCKVATCYKLVPKQEGPGRRRLYCDDHRKPKDRIELPLRDVG